MRLDIQLYNQALDYVKEGQWHESEMLLVQAIGLNSQEAEYHSLLAVAFLGLGLTSRAIEQLRMAHELNPSDPLLQHHLPLLILGGNDSSSGFDTPPDSGSRVPSPPKPSTPNVGAETLPDQGVSKIP